MAKTAVSATTSRQTEEAGRRTGGLEEEEDEGEQAKDEEDKTEAGEATAELEGCNVGPVCAVRIVHKVKQSHVD